MKLSAFSVAIVAVLLASASAQAFPFGKKGDAASETATEASQSSAGYQSERFRNMDKNHDGKISEEEFLADQRAEFARLDQDHDKSVSPDELDLPPGLSAEQKNMMRKQMQDRENMMKKRRADNLKMMEEDQKRMQAEQAARQKAAATPAPTTAPVTKTEDVKKEREEVKQEDVQKPATNPVGATEVKGAPAFTSGAASKAVTYTSTSTTVTTPVFTSGSASKTILYTSSTATIPHAVVPAVTPHTTVPAVKH